MCLIVTGGVVLGEMVCQIVFSNHPMYQKFSLPDSATYPLKLHGSGSWTFLSEYVIEKSASCGAVCHFWGECLGMDHLYERHARRYASMTVLKMVPSFAYIVLARMFLVVVHST